MVFKYITAVLLWLLVTLTSAFGFMASELETAPSDFFYETVDCAEQNDFGTRDTCWENGWLNYDTTSGYCVATNKAGNYKTWNQFQSGTKGQFASRADAGKAWQSYKKANGITTGAVRSQAQKSAFLKDAASSGNYPKWMNQWMNKGKVPPGYHVDHIKPISIGGPDLPSNMRLLDIDMHKVHHQFYRPWQ